MTIHERTEHLPITMIFCFAFFDTEDFKVIFIHPSDTNLDYQLARDAQYPYLEAFSVEHDRVYCIGAWLSHKTLDHDNTAEQVNLYNYADRIKTFYKFYLAELDREEN